jgi:hypothetical protein
MALWERTLRRGRLARLGLALALLAAGCDALPGSTPFPTITPDATYRAIPRMLTQTAAAPTVTRTPLRSATPTRTPTVTPTATPYPGSERAPGVVGERMAMGADGAAFTVLAASAPESIPDLRAVEGETYLELDLLIENQSGAPLEYNRLDFHLVTDAAATSGASSEAAPEATGLEPLSSSAGPLLLSGTLRPGEWVRGSAAFRVHEAAGSLRLRWQVPQVGREAWVRVEVGISAGDAQAPAAGSANGSDDLPLPGQRVIASGISLSIDQVQAGATAFRRRAAAGSRFVILSVTIANEDRDRAPFNADYFRAKDGDGVEYMPVEIPSDALIGAGSLGRGQRVRGQVVFMLPEGAPDVVIKYRPQVLVDPYEEIRVRVQIE